MLKQLKLKCYYLPEDLKRAGKLGLTIILGFGCVVLWAKYEQYSQNKEKVVDPSHQEWVEQYAKEMVEKEVCELNYGREYCKYR